MNDFEFDIMQKKSIAHSARKQKIGTRSKKCSLPSDRLTNKQWKERNGEVMSYNPSKPMEWSEFKMLPSRVQEEYIIGLQKKYSVTATDIAKMFGVKPLTITRHVVAKELNVSFHRGRSMSTEQRAEFAKFLNGDVTEETTPTAYASRDDVCDEHPSEDSGDTTMRMCGVSLTFAGKIDIDAIANSLRHILGTDAVGKIQIICDTDYQEEKENT